MDTNIAPSEARIEENLIELSYLHTILSATVSFWGVLGVLFEKQVTLNIASKSRIIQNFPIFDV